MRLRCPPTSGRGRSLGLAISRAPLAPRLLATRPLCPARPGPLMPPLRPLPGPGASTPTRWHSFWTRPRGDRSSPSPR
eukprot:1134599-Alexandrium_andersonii.AAC.1